MRCRSDARCSIRGRVGTRVRTHTYPNAGEKRTVSPVADGLDACVGLPGARFLHIATTKLAVGWEALRVPLHQPPRKAAGPKGPPALGLQG